MLFGDTVYTYIYIFQPAAAQVMDDQHQMTKWIVTMPVTAPW